MLTEENREISLGPNRIVHIAAYSLNTHLPREVLVERLKKIVECQKELMRNLSIKDLWELVVREGEGFTLRNLTELTFDSAASSDHEMALFRTLSEDRVYFKQKGDLYEPRAPEMVEQISLQLEREAEQEREIQEASVWLAGVWAGEMGPPPEKKTKIIDLLKEMALFGPEAANHSKGKILLERAKISSPQAPFELLVRLGEWGEDETFFYTSTKSPRSSPRKCWEKWSKSSLKPKKEFQFIRKIEI